MNSNNDEKSREQLVKKISELQSKLDAAELRNRDLSDKITRSDENLLFRELFHRLFEKVPALLVIWDSRLHRFTLNQYAVAVLGWTNSDANEENFMRKVYPDADYRTEVASYMRSLQSGWRELNTTAKDGSVVPISWANIRLTDDTMVGIGVDLRERKNAEETLLKSEMKHSAILEQLPIGVALINSDGQSTLSNSVYRRYVPKTIPSKDANRTDRWKAFNPDGSLIPPNMWPGARALRGETVSPGLECQYADNYGQERWAQVSAVPFRVKGKEISQVIVTIEDITERKQAEQSLRKSETHLRSLIRTIPDLIWLKDLKGVYLSCNPRFESFFGAKENDIIGKTDYDFVDKKLADSFLKHDQIAMQKTQPSINEEEITFAADGHREIIETIKTPMYTADGKLAGVLGIGRNITHRKQAEEALKKSHQRFLTVMNSIQANIYVADMQTHEVLFMNKHMIDAFGRDMTGENCWSALCGESEPCAYCINDQLIGENGKPTGVHVWQDKHPITGRWYVNHDRAIEWTDGRLVRFQFATDITELKKIEDDLRQTHKMDALGTLAGGIAHDFNNILSAIIGFTELSFDEVEKGSYLEDNLNEVFTAGKRAGDLVNQILTFARQTEDEFKPIRVDIIVKEVLKFLRSSIPASIAIGHNIESDSLILGDPTQLHEILMNLCSNAAYAMEAGSGILQVSLKDITIDGTPDKAIAGLHSGEYMELEVADTGTGIPSDIIQSIFEPYFTTKPIGEGTGMGLAIVHGIVRNHGGKITVDSKVGQGTTFTIYLPITKKRSRHRAKETAVLPKGTERILFVDDEAAITRLAGRMLKQMGYQVTVRTSSVEALELFKIKPDEFDLVVTDMTMPNLTGDLLAVELMNIRADIPVILCTGYSKKISDESVVEMGIKALIKKPIIKSELTQTIRRVLAMTQP